MCSHRGIRDHGRCAIEDFNSVVSAIYTHIVDELIAAAQRDSDVIYAVPGHPLVGEATTPMIVQRARVLKIATRIVAGLSFIEPTLEQVSRASLDTLHASFDPLNGLQICDALDLASMHHPPLNPDKPALIAQVYSRAIASDLKLTLMNQYPPEHSIYIVQGAGRDKMTMKGKIAKRAALSFMSPPLLGPLHSLDHTDTFDHLTSLVVPPLAQMGGFEAFQETIAHLRRLKGVRGIVNNRTRACAQRCLKKPTKC